MLKCAQCMLQRTFVENTVLRTLGTSPQSNNEKATEKETPGIPSKDQKEVLNIPVINKLKVYQAGITGIFTSGALILNQLDHISTDLFLTIATTGIAGCIPFYTIGYLTGNFIGYIYYNEQTDMAIISYIDKRGRRKDLELPVNDIIPLKDLPVHRWNSLWFTFRRYSTNDTLKINTKYAIFVDEEQLQKVI